MKSEEVFLLLCLCLAIRIHKSFVFVLETESTGLQGYSEFLEMMFILPQCSASSTLLLIIVA